MRPVIREGRRPSSELVNPHFFLDFIPRHKAGEQAATLARVAGPMVQILTQMYYTQSRAQPREVSRVMIFSRIS